MKNAQKLPALLMAIAMVLSLGSAAFASSGEPSLSGEASGNASGEAWAPGNYDGVTIDSLGAHLL